LFFGGYMIHVYKLGGDWVTKDGLNYTIKAINNEDREKALSSGWFIGLADAEKADKKPVKKVTKNVDNKD